MEKPKSRVQRKEGPQDHGLTIKASSRLSHRRLGDVGKIACWNFKGLDIIRPGRVHRPTELSQHAHDKVSPVNRSLILSEHPLLNQLVSKVDGFDHGQVPVSVWPSV
jgi:hypothetical protein